MILKLCCEIMHEVHKVCCNDGNKSCYGKSNWSTWMSFVCHSLLQLSHKETKDSGWLPLVKDLYYSQEKGLSLLLKKRKRKTEEYALHGSINVVDSRYHTSSKFGSLILEKQPTVRHQLQREAVISNNTFCTVLCRLLYCYFCESIY